ncbi:MAG: efflux RND transporter periplasmic adaptor subunit [Rhodanobacteraceae bacterium]|nr:MAG: efflux RND transporter periplasmic adaptor subunit [Rhodanobacteraceae bacterium]
MNKPRVILIALITVLLALVAEYFLGKRGTPAAGHAAPAAAAAATKRKVLYWQAPMNPSYHSDKPGTSPMGMPLVPVYAGGSNGNADVKIDPDVVNNLGVRTSEVRQGSLSNRIEAVGYVGYDEDTLTSINTRADGWIEQLAVNNVGATVQRGQLLYELFSPKLATAEREYLTALGSGSRSLIDASRQRMQALGFTAGQVQALTRTRKVSDRVARYAGRAGVVTGLNVREGAYVTLATPVMKIADLSTVWVLVEVDEGQAALVHKGQQAVAAFDAFPGQHWTGTVDYVYPDLSAATRTVKLRLRFDNPGRRLQPNMFAHVRIAAAPQTSAVYIPNQALIRTGHGQRVIVALGQGRFDVCPVQAGTTSGDQVEILKGLRPGQQVVTSAQFMIDSEANVDAAALRLGGGRAGCRLPAATNTSAHAEQSPEAAAMPGMAMPGGGSSTAPASAGAASPAPASSSAGMEGMPMADGKRHTAPKAISAAASSNKRQQP